jgi:photosystem II stability/assembly factor-like uncharacterized protein
VIAALVLAALAALTVGVVGGFSGHGRSIETSRATVMPGAVENETDEAGISRAYDEWFYGQRAHPAAHTPAGALARATRQAKALRGPERPLAAPTTPIGWTLRGPKPISAAGPYAVGRPGAGSFPLSGRVSSIAPDPNNANVVYIGGANGGVWKTTNAYGSPVAWTAKFPYSASFSIGAIAVDKSSSTCSPTPSSCRIWVGTGEPNGSGDTYYGQGIYRSLNGGATWTKASGTLFNGCFVSDLVVVNANTIVAGVLEFPGVTNPACPTAKRGVWRTTNATAAAPTWTRLTLPSSPSQAPADFAQAPGAPNTIFLITYRDGVYRSTNGGSSWTRIATVGGAYRGAITAYNASLVYFVYSGGATRSSFDGVYKLTNASSSSPTLTTAVPAASSNSPCTYPSGSSGQCGYDLTIAVDPGNPTRFFGGGIRVYRYTNGGAVGTPVGFGSCSGCIHVDQHATVFDRANHLWEGSDGGVYRTDNLGSSFVNRNGSGSGALAITEFNGWTSGSIAGGTFIGGTQDNGTTKYTSLTGLNWRMDQGGDGGASAFYSSSTYFASYYYPAVYRTTSGGSSFSKITTSTIDNEASEFYPPLEAGASAATLYRGTNRIWRTTNATTGSPPTWTAISPIYARTVSAIGPSTSTASYLYAAWDASPTQMRYTHNATAAVPTWWNSSGLPDRFITDVLVNPSSANNAIATVSGFGSPHVYKTTNGGASWTSISGNLPNVPVNAVAVQNWSTGRIFVGTDAGVFWTIDGGATWGNTSVGFPNTTVMDLRIVGGQLIAATHGRSVYTAPLPT